ncbi:Tyrosine/DOPA decarboxylase 1 [Vitis vinifera]|uniref:Tyrosine/DOPA decarboxylase 1 n=1 Tax=Vitis vinifera TaxID=29760 RepID=A0A438JEH0_VITVI|nr:Tyrosine/DOPA decarboxylase 1 [Vitis vinifera]
MGSLSFNTFSPLDPQSFSEESKMVVDFIADYYKNVEKYPVQSQVDPGYLMHHCPDTAPYCPEPLETILKDVSDSIIPGLTHWQSPNFFGYFQANASTAGFLGEMLCTGLNVVGFNWIASPAATELESIVMDWVGKMLMLPPSFLFSGGGGGVLHGSTCEAIICSLAAARDKVLKKIGHHKTTKLVVYSSDQTHSTLQKASKLVDDVRTAMEEDIAAGLVPLFLCATVGTTSSGAVDPLEALGHVAKDFKVWLHIDAAYAGSACICPEFRHHLNGVELAHSITMNTHKWLLTNMDCCCLWIKEPKLFLDSLSTAPEYLRNNASESKKVIDYKDWQIALSRRFRAIKVWVVIRRHGLDNLMFHIRSDVNLAKRFEAHVATDPRFEVVVPRSGAAFMTHAVVGGIYIIRCAIGSTLTEIRHVDSLWKLIQEKAQLVLQEPGLALEED